MEPDRRGRFRGVVQVAQFNWPKVLGGAVVAVAGAAVDHRLHGLPWPVRWSIRLGGLGAAFWTPVSLAASWWVYDRSPLHRWRFFADRLPGPPRSVLVVVAGFDEVSAVIGEVFPDAEVDVVDVVTDPEPSVRRARRLYPAQAPVVRPDRLGRGRRYDLVLFAQSAHEIRQPGPRHAMFAAARHAVGPGGRVVVVEHVLDPANVVAFGPGAWHFQTTEAWLASYRAGGLRVEDHQQVTPLVHCWVLAAP